MRSMASFLRLSRVSISSLILSWPLTASSCRLTSSSLWSMKFTYWSSAFLFTCLYHSDLHHARLCCHAVQDHSGPHDL